MDDSGEELELGDGVGFWAWHIGQRCHNWKRPKVAAQPPGMTGDLQ